jgi:proline iminopeptidase
MISAGDVTLYTRLVGGGIGSAPPVVIIHGGPGYEHDYLVGLDRLASADRRLVYYDQRGSGRSTKPASSAFGFDAQVADLEAVRIAIGADKLDLLGHSWGGLPAVAYAIAHPDHVAHLVIVGSMSPSAEQMKPATDTWRARRQKLADANLVPPRDPAATPDQRCAPGLAFWFANPRDPHIEQLHITCTAATSEATDAAIDGWDFRPALATLAIPTLVITGTDDPLTLATLPYGELIPGAQTVTFPACGHFPYLECPEPFYAAVTKFLAR